MILSAVLLAGGESSRMGRDKATMPFRGEPLWKHQLDLLRRIQPKEILVSARTDPPWRPSDTTFVADEQPDCGPLGGIAAALRRITTDYLFVLAIDAPFMSESYVRRLCEQIRAGQGVVPVIEKRAEPLVAIYPRESTIEFNRALSGRDFSLQPLVRKLIALSNLRPVEVLPQELSLFRNLNEPRDLPDR